MASIEKLEPGRYEIRWRTPEGKSRRKILRGGPEQARRFARNIEAAKDHGDYIDPRAGKAMVARWAMKWLDGVRPTLKPKTAASYESLLRSRVVPSLGQRRISKLKPSQLQEWIGEMQAERLSASRVRQAHVVLRQVLDTAVRDGAVARNAALGAKLPKLERREAAFFEPSEVEKIAAKFPPPYDLLARLLSVSGLRWAEAVGLERWNVDLLRRRISVLTTLSEVAGGFIRTTTKSHAQRRVPIPPSLVSALERHLEDLDPGRDSLAFRGPKGGPLRYRYFYMNLWRPTLDQLGLPVVGVHVLRHSAAARMIASGWSPKAVQQVMGHRSVAFTLDTYGHLFETDLDDLAIRLDDPNIGGMPIDTLSTEHASRAKDQSASARASVSAG
jgi:integrase